MSHAVAKGELSISASNGSAPRVILRPIGSPLTLAMAGLAIGSLVHSGLDLHWIAKDQTAEVGLILLAVPFLLQGTASVLSFLARDGSAGAALGVMAVTWLALGLLHVVSPTDSRSGAMGLMLLGATGMLALSALSISNMKPLPALVFALAALRFGLAGIYELGAAKSWLDIAGIVGLIVVGASAYAVLAFELEGQKRRPVLPTFRRGRAREALLGSADAAVDDVVHDAGVRHTT